MTYARIDEVARSAVALVLWLIAVTLNMAAMIWVGLQGVRWLHDGYWTKQPPVMFWLHQFCPGWSAFLNNPHSWYGVAKVALILSELPSGLALILVGTVFAVLNVSVCDRRPEPPSVTKSHIAASC